jgi:hypothetical protein
MLDCRAMRILWLCVLSALSLGAQAREWQLGARYWYSEGSSTRSHNAQGLAPSLGNPTSVLTYDDLAAHSVELFARRGFEQGWFARGNAGVGSIRHGMFDDEDFLAGQIKFSDSTSSVRGNDLRYITVDVGRELWRLRNGAAGVFVGFHYWNERLDAFGASFTVGGLPTIPDSEIVITNHVTWRALRAGITSMARLGGRTRFTIDAALVPYAKVRDEDSHWLRQDPGDLGTAPNIFVKGRGYGMEVDLELHHEFRDAWEISAGFRYWLLRARDGTREAVGIGVPLRELESQRGGLTLGVARRW